MELRETFRVLHPRLTTFGLPNQWWVWAMIPAILGFGFRFFWFMPVSVPLYFLLKWAYSEDEYWVEIWISFMSQSHAYLA